MSVGGIFSIIIIVILTVILYKWLKPYIIKYDTTILFTGGLGSGKTLESVKKSILLVRKNRVFKYYLHNWWVKNFSTPYRHRKNNKKLLKMAKATFKNRDVKPFKLMKYKKLNKMPYLYSNIPVNFKTHSWFWSKREWATKLTVKHIMLIKEINEYSVVLIDEFPQFISQFEWDVDLVQKNCNEFITFFRHYIGGHLIINAQSEDEIECHFRRKLNIGIWCFDFKKHLFGLFYTNRMCDFMLSENVQTMSTTYIEENTKLHFGLFPRKCYDSRCYSVRYEKVPTKLISTAKWRDLKTKEVLKLKPYISPLDTKTTPRQIENMEREIEKLERNNDNEN